jgi:hypothetical protein
MKTVSSVIFFFRRYVEFHPRDDDINQFLNIWSNDDSDTDTHMNIRLNNKLYPLLGGNPTQTQCMIASLVIPLQIHLPFL